MAIGKWNPGPNEHRRSRPRDVPPDSIQAADQHIPPFLIPEYGFLDTVLRSIQRNDAGNLQRLKNAVIQVALNLGQRANDLSISDTKPHTPSRHVVGLGKGIELDADILSPRDLQKTRCLVSVEYNVGISKVVDDDHLMFYGKCDDLLKKFQVYHLSGRIVRKINDQNFGSRECLPINTLEVIEEVAVWAQFNPADLSSCNDKTIHVDGICGCGGQNDIARPNHCQR